LKIGNNTQKCGISNFLISHLIFKDVKLSKLYAVAIIATFVFMPKAKTILVAPLNWGLGHATRCIPIIRALLQHNYSVLLASDGAALLLLQKEFPSLESIKLPSYNITYPKNGRNFKWQMLLKLPHILKTISAEKKYMEQLVSERNLHGIISDNRFGVRSARVPSVYITHQLKVLSGNTSFFSSKIHQKIIEKFDVCWIPDVANKDENLSGKLGHLNNNTFPVESLGVLSRMQKEEVTPAIDVLLLLSGPEPQRSLFEAKLKAVFKESDKNIIMVRGMIEENQKWETFGNIRMVNFLTSHELEETINKSKLVVCRSGYTTIMDLTILEKQVFFVPTPGQYEQEYLAKRLENIGIAPSCTQEHFSLKELDRVKNYKGLIAIPAQPVNFSKLFSLFEGK
tara:strand:+ start:800 stop:1990 length:1191 start_codon:yes stop_codon:yes gene_type:complete